MGYTLSVTDKQLEVINEALESYFRTRMNQWTDFCNEVALNGYVYDKDNPENSKLFREYIYRRNKAEDMFRKAYDIAAPNLYERSKTSEVQIAIDIWHVIRHQFYLERPEPKDHWTTDATEPFQCASEPLPTVEKVEEDGEKETKDIFEVRAMVKKVEELYEKKIRELIEGTDDDDQQN